MALLDALFPQLPYGFEMGIPHGTDAKQPAVPVFVGIGLDLVKTLRVNSSRRA